jgi:hypothetical protein
MLSLLDENLGMMYQRLDAQKRKMSQFPNTTARKERKGKFTGTYNSVYELRNLHQSLACDSNQHIV